MGETFGPTSGAAGINLGEDYFIRVLGPMLRGGDGIDGVPGISTALQVYANGGGRQVYVRPGHALIRGIGYALDGADLLVTIPANATGSDRIDRIVVRHDPSLGDAIQGTITRIPGTPGAGAPAITRVAGGVWDVTLAKVTVPPGALVIAANQVTDDRQWLPSVVPYMDSRVAVLPIDGSQGWIAYDVAPSKFGLWQTDGSKWRQVVVNDDTGPQPVDTSAHDLAITPTFASTRKRSGVVELIYWANVNWDVRYPGGSNTAPGWAGQLPPGMRPAVNRSFAIPDSNDTPTATGGGSAHLDVSTTGLITLHGNIASGSTVAANVMFFADN